MKMHRYGSGNKRRLPIGSRPLTERRRQLPCHISIKEAEKLKTGDRRMHEEEFYGKPPVPITIVPRPQ
tara:strand:+ start:1156 stop:1359 length:204 start_codon:yes stop_codon:yes gene_type:complete